MEDIKTHIKKASQLQASEMSPLLLECIEMVKESEFLGDEDTASSLIAIIKNTSDTSSTSRAALQLVADIARVESNRPLFKDEALMRQLLDYLTSDSPEVTLQAVRCLANICAENPETCDMFLHLGGIEKIVTKAKEIENSNDDEWKKIVPSACACIRNLISSNDTLQDKFLENDTLALLWRYAIRYHATDLNITTYAISGISSLTDSSGGLQKLEDSRIMEEIHNMLVQKQLDDDVIKVLLEEMLTGYGSQENTRVILCKIGYVGTLCNIIEERRNFSEKVCTDTLMKDMADLVVMLTSGEESFPLMQQKEKMFLSRISRWIASPNSHIQVSSGLVLGNYARSEETCQEIMANQIHENLINVIKENIDNDDSTDDEDSKKFFDKLQSYASCLRNLTIPVENKPKLIEAGLHHLAICLIKKPSLGVQFKGLGILRLLIQGNADITTTILSDKDLVAKINELSEVSAVTSVPSEAQRLMAGLLKYNTDDQTLKSALMAGAFKPVLCLLKSDHVLMQNEGLVGLIIAVANLSDCLPLLTEHEVLEKVINLMNTSGVQTQTLFNCITFLQAVSSLDGGLVHLKSLNVTNVLENLNSHSEEIIRSKVIETLSIVQ